MPNTQGQLQIYGGCCILKKYAVLAVKPQPRLRFWLLPCGLVRLRCYFFQIWITMACKEWHRSGLYCKYLSFCCFGVKEQIFNWFSFLEVSTLLLKSRFYFLEVSTLLLKSRFYFLFLTKNDKKLFIKLHNSTIIETWHQNNI